MDANETVGQSPTAPVLRSCFSEHKAVRRVLPLFVGDLPLQVGSMATHLAQGDLLSLRRLVHGLRGSGGGYGFPDITTLASDAEAAIDSQRELSSITASVDALIALLRRVDGYDRAREAVNV